MAEEDDHQTIQDTILAITSGWALSLSQTPYASVGYGLFLMKGLVGVVKSVVDTTPEDNLYKLYDNLDYMSRALGAPLMTTDMCIKLGLKWEISAIQLVIPAVDLVCHYALEDNDVDPKVKDVSRLASLGLLAWKCFESGANELGYAFALTDLVAELGEKKENMPHCYAVLLGACCVFCSYFMSGKSLL